QAERVAARLARPHEPPALPLPEGRPLAIVHSPLRRAADTAAAIGRAISAGAEGQGVWEGRLASEIQAADGERLAAWRSRPAETWAPGGERLAAVKQRVVAGLADVLSGLAAAGPPGSLAAPQVGGYHDGPATHAWSIL